MMQCLLSRFVLSGLGKFTDNDAQLNKNKIIPGGWGRDEVAVSLDMSG